MSTYNSQTITVYNKNAIRYTELTAQDYTESRALLKQWIDTTLSLMPTGLNILEIGSATKRDADYMRRKGHTVQCTDASEGFVNILNESGENAYLFNPITDDIPTGFDLIFANAVVPHFTVEDLRFVLKKIQKALPQDGMFAFNVKNGDGDEWINEKFKLKRYTHYWHPAELYNFVENSGFKIIYFESGAQGERSNHIWTRVNAIKK